MAVNFVVMHRKNARQVQLALLGVGLATVIVTGCASGSRSTTMRETAANEPTCLLSPEELEARREGLLPGLIKRAKHTTKLDNGYTMRFDSRPGLLDELTRVIEQERGCCSFLRFQISVEPENGPVTFEVTGPPGTREMLDKL
jgi:hypothetical protein